MRLGWKWGAVIGLATLIDLAARFLWVFDRTRVLRVETVLFPLAALVMWGIFRREPADGGWARGLKLTLIIAFLLGGLRAGLWAAGIPVFWANVSTAGVLIAGLLLAWWFRPAL